MFGAVFFSEVNRGLFYKVKKKYYLDETLEFVCFFAPAPKGKNDVKILDKAISEYKGKLIFQNNFKYQNFFKGYCFDSENFIKRCLAEAFFIYCKTQRPKSVLIYDNGFLKNEYLIKLSRYTEHLDIRGVAKDMLLAEEILRESGIVIWRKNLANELSATLDLSNINQENSLYKVLFNKHLLTSATARISCFLPEVLKDFPPLEALALLFYECGETSALNMCVKFVLDACNRGDFDI